MTEKETEVMALPYLKISRGRINITDMLCPLTSSLKIEDIVIEKGIYIPVLVYTNISSICPSDFLLLSKKEFIDNNWKWSNYKWKRMVKILASDSGFVGFTTRKNWKNNKLKNYTLFKDCLFKNPSYIKEKNKYVGFFAPAPEEGVNLYNCYYLENTEGKVVGLRIKLLPADIEIEF